MSIFEDLNIKSYVKFIIFSNAWSVIFSFKIFATFWTNLHWGSTSQYKIASKNVYIYLPTLTSFLYSESQKKTEKRKSEGKPTKSSEKKKKKH